MSSQRQPTMERSSLSNSLKDHSVGSTKACNNNKLKDSWSYNSQSYGGGGDDGYLGGFSWPPRSYTCSFCKREFRSAQALGGHMNVHRRDRARLRQSPPTPCPILNLNLTPNPNPNPSFSSTASITCCTLPSLVSPSFVSPAGEMKKWAVVEHGCGSPDLRKMEDFVAKKDGCKLLMKKGEIVRLDLEIGSLVRDHPKEDLDLELRLGYS